MSEVQFTCPVLRVCVCGTMDATTVFESGESGAVRRDAGTIGTLWIIRRATRVHDWNTGETQSYPCSACCLQGFSSMPASMVASRKHPKTSEQSTAHDTAAAKRMRGRQRVQAQRQNAAHALPPGALRLPLKFSPRHHCLPTSSPSPRMLSPPPGAVQGARPLFRRQLQQNVWTVFHELIYRVLYGETGFIFKLRNTDCSQPMFC